MSFSERWTLKDSMDCWVIENQPLFRNFYVACAFAIRRMRSTVSGSLPEQRNYVLEVKSLNDFRQVMKNVQRRPYEEYPFPLCESVPEFDMLAAACPRSSRSVAPE